MPNTVRLDCFCVNPCCLLLSSPHPQVAGEVAEQPRVRLTPRPPSTPPPSTPGESADQVASKARPRPPWRVPQEQQQQEQQQQQRQRSTIEVRITTWGQKKPNSYRSGPWTAS